MTSVLIVEDDAGVRTTLAIALRRAGFAVEEAPSCADAQRRLETRGFDAIVSDYKLGDGNGVDLLRWLRGRGSASRVVIVTAYGSIPLAVEAMRDGASHFMAKPVEPEALVAALRGAGPPSGVVARSPAMAKCLDLARQAAAARSPVLITGPTGAGKEIVARAVHDLGPRREGPFVTINCAAVAPSLFESEFFGHVRGAFTGAADDRPGVFREAHGGTLLLDEVGEIPASLQAKLLRAIETGEIRPVGAAADARSDTRVIATTNADPKKLREDLYFRLAAVRIDVPPLAARREDILPLADLFLRQFAAVYAKPASSFSPAARQALEAHGWPGNARELRHVVERAVVASTRAAVDVSIDAPSAAGRDLDSVERAHILQVLEECGRSRAEAARRLGISRSTLRRKLIDWGLGDSE